MNQVDVKKLREQLKLTRREFSRKYGISKTTLREWEVNICKPKGVSLVLLNLISKEPDWTAEVLANVAKEKGYASFGEYNCPDSFI